MKRQISFFDGVAPYLFMLWLAAIATAACGGRGSALDPATGDAGSAEPGGAGPGDAGVGSNTGGLGGSGASRGDGIGTGAGAGGNAGSNGGGSGEVAVAGMFEVLDTTLDFGTHSVGSRAVRSIRVVNRTNANVPYRVSFSGPARSAFAQTNRLSPCPSNQIPAGNSCEISVAFTPTGVGVLLSELALTTASDTFRVALRATVRPASVLAVSPASFVAFPDTATGESHAEFLEIRNTSSVAIGPLSIMAPAASSVSVTSECLGLTLQPEASCSVQVSFSPVGQGPVSDVFSVAGPGAEAVFVSVAGVGVARLQTTMTPNVHDFGSVRLDAPPEPARFTFSASGPANTTTGVLQTRIPIGFTVVGDTCSGIRLGSGSSCQLSIGIRTDAGLLLRNGSVVVSDSDIDRARSQQELTLNAASASITATIDPGRSDSSLVGHWKLDKAAGATVDDASGNGNDGLLQPPNARTSAGKLGRAVTFNGTSTNIQIDGTASMRWPQENRAFTVSAWVALDRFDDRVPRSVFSQAGFGSTTGFGISVFNGIPFLAIAPAQTVQATGPIPLRQWAHLAGTYDGSTARLFVNGQEVASSAANWAAFSEDEPYAIGARLLSNGSTTWNFQGRIDDVYVFAEALTAEEIRARM